METSLGVSKLNYIECRFRNGNNQIADFLEIVSGIDIEHYLCHLRNGSIIEFGNRKAGKNIIKIDLRNKFFYRVNLEVGVDKITHMEFCYQNNCEGTSIKKITHIFNVSTYNRHNSNFEITGIAYAHNNLKELIKFILSD